MAGNKISSIKTYTKKSGTQDDYKI